MQCYIKNELILTDQLLQRINDDREVKELVLYNDISAKELTKMVSGLNYELKSRQAQNKLSTGDGSVENSFEMLKKEEERRLNIAKLKMRILEVMKGKYDPEKQNEPMMYEDNL